MNIKKEKYNYYFDEKEVSPVVMVCYLWLESGVVGRGVAVCSKQDAYDENIGMGLAKNHAMRAIKGRQIDSFKRKEVISLLIESRCPFTKKGEKNPELSWWERKFLFGWRKMDKYRAGWGWNMQTLTAKSPLIGCSDIYITR